MRTYLPTGNWPSHTIIKTYKKNTKNINKKKIGY